MFFYPLQCIFRIYNISIIVFLESAISVTGVFLFVQCYCYNIIRIRLVPATTIFLNLHINQTAAIMYKWAKYVCALTIDTAMLKGMSLIKALDKQTDYKSIEVFHFLWGRIYLTLFTRFT